MTADRRLQLSALRRIYVDAETAILRVIAQRIGAGLDAPDWALIKAREIVLLRGQVDRQLAILARDGTAASGDLIQSAWAGAAAGAISDLSGAGIVTGSLLRSNPVSARILADATRGLLNGVHVRILRSSLDSYRAIVADVSGRVVTGVATRQVAAQSALDRLAARGLTGFVDSAGRNWDAATYVEMAVRTAVTRTSVEAFADTMTAHGHDLVRVSTSYGACPFCLPWEGQVLSLSGTDPKYASLSEAEGAGLHHPNCTHREGIYLPGESEPPPSIPDDVQRQRNDEREQQRYIERQIRGYKSRAAVALDANAARLANDGVRRWQGQMRTFINQTGRFRQPEREQIGRAR